MPTHEPGGIHAQGLRRRGAATTEDTALLAAAFDALETHVAILDEDGVILLVNEAWRRFALANDGQSEQSYVGESYLAACAPETAGNDPYARRAWDALLDLLAGRRTSATFEYPCHSPRRPRWFIFRGSVFQVDGERRILVAHENITRRRLDEDALRVSHEAMQSFNAAVAHDLRAPLRRIETLSELGSHAEDPAALLDRIRQESARARRLANDLLELARSSTQELARQPVDVGAYARDIVRALAEAEPHRRVEVVVHEPLVADADPGLVRLILTNLLGNAWKFTAHRNPGRIEVGAVEDEGQRRFFVRDNGIGFAPEQAVRLFQPFARLANAGGYEGSGVGLAIVRRAVDRHGGTVRAAGVPDAGATFSFTLGED